MNLEFSCSVRTRVRKTPVVPCQGSSFSRVPHMLRYCCLVEVQQYSIHPNYIVQCYITRDANVAENSIVADSETYQHRSAAMMAWLTRKLAEDHHPVLKAAENAVEALEVLVWCCSAKYTSLLLRCCNSVQMYDRSSIIGRKTSF